MRVLLRWVLIVTVLIVLVVGAVRLATLPWFPRWAYGRSDFPPDVYGMSPEERLRLAQVCVAFLNLPHDRSLLATLRLDDGTPAFNERELRHMDDVKIVYDRLTVWAMFALVLAVCAAWVFWRRGEMAMFWGALSDAGLFTLLVSLALGLLMLLAWETFFVGLHDVFFEPDTWRFYYSDTLIRLFPEMLWQLAGMVVAAQVLGAAFVLALGGRIIQRRLLWRAD